MAAVELITGNVTAPGTTETILTPGAGNSYTLRNGAENIRLLAAWTDVQGAGIFKIRSPRMHDNVQGFRVQTIASDLHPYFFASGMQKLFENDTLLVSLSGSATAGDIEIGCILVYYDSLPGIAGRFINHSTLMAQGINVLTVEQTITAGTAGGYSGQQTLVADFDLLKANTDYALIGASVSTETAALRWTGSDFGNLGLGMPGIFDDRSVIINWFDDISRMYQDLNCIPVINSNNKNNVLVDVANDENANSPIISTILVELAGS